MKFELKESDWAVIGVIIAALSLLIAYLQLLRTPKVNKDKRIGEDGEINSKKNNDPKTSPSNQWQAISPPNSRYKTVSKLSNSIPAGIQTISLEYDTIGHAYPLNLKGSSVRTEISFECQINNAKKAVFAGNEYALNFLPSKFLMEARIILEKYSIKKLQDERIAIALEIAEELKNDFNKYGFTLLKVSIGAVTKI